MPHKKNVPPGNFLSWYGTFLLFSSFIQIFPHPSAALLPPALQDARQLFTVFLLRLLSCLLSGWLFYLLSDFSEGIFAEAATAAGAATRFFLNVFMVYHRAPVMHTEEYAPPMIPTISGAANSLIEETPIT